MINCMKGRSRMWTRFRVQSFEVTSHCGRRWLYHDPCRNRVWEGHSQVVSNQFALFDWVMKKSMITQSVHNCHCYRSMETEATKPTWVEAWLEIGKFRWYFFPISLSFVPNFAVILLISPLFLHCFYIWQLKIKLLLWFNNPSLSLFLSLSSPILHKHFNTNIIFSL